MELLLAVCTRGTDIHYKTLAFLLATANRVNLAELHIQPSFHSAADGQEAVFKKFSTGDYEYLMLIDSDVVPQLDAYEKMKAHSKQIVLAPVWHFDDNIQDIHIGAHNKWDISSIDRWRTPHKGLERIVHGGFGCMLIHREVASRFNMAKQEFVRWSSLLLESCKDRASDNIFWAKCYRLGISDIWIDWSIHTIHYRSVGLCNELVERIRGTKH